MHQTLGNSYDVLVLRKHVFKTDAILCCTHYRISRYSLHFSSAYYCVTAVERDKYIFTMYLNFFLKTDEAFKGVFITPGR